MAQLTKKVIVSHNSDNTRNDEFYVKFFRLPENISNLLGSSVKSIVPPSIEFETVQTRYRKNTYNDIQKPIFRPITIVFRNDVGGIVSMFMHTQIMRQLKIHKNVLNGIYGDDKYYKFDIEVDIVGTDNIISESMILSDCTIVEFERTAMTYGDETDGEFTVLIQFDNIDFKVYDQYLTIEAGLQD